MNIGLIFAGGSGIRMNTKSRPKQFLLLNGKPILIYTLEIFENHPDIDAIIVVCIESWIPYLEKMIKKYELTKIRRIISGGVTGSESIYKGLLATKAFHLESGDITDPIVLIHDGVRPLIYEQTISDNIAKVKECGSCITVVPANETIIVSNNDGSFDIPYRKSTKLARAPQSFFLKDILDAHEQRIKDGIPEFIDSCSLMNHYGYPLGFVSGPMENIKITTPTDFFLFRAMVEAIENQQIFGLH